MKIIASDYDGTLNYHGISQKVRDALVFWQSKGNKFGIVSGRGIYNILSVVKHEKVSCDFLIANNGSVVADGEGNILLHRTGNPHKTREVVCFLMENGCWYACINDLAGDLFVTTAEDKETKHSDDSRFVALADFDKLIAFTQISTVCRTDEEAEKLTARLNETFPRDIAAFQNGICIDIVPYGVDKAKGIASLCELWGIAYEDVATVGDNKNDIAMLSAYRSYAVANAVDMVKNIAGSVVADLSELIDREFRL